MQGSDECMSDNHVLKQTTVAIYLTVFSQTALNVKPEQKQYGDDIDNKLVEMG